MKRLGRYETGKDEYTKEKWFVRHEPRKGEVVRETRTKEREVVRETRTKERDTNQGKGYTKEKWFVRHEPRKGRLGRYETGKDEYTKEKWFVRYETGKDEYTKEKWFVRHEPRKGEYTKEKWFVRHEPRKGRIYKGEVVRETRTKERDEFIVLADKAKKLYPKTEQKKKRGAIF